MSQPVAYLLVYVITGAFITLCFDIHFYPSLTPSALAESILAYAQGSENLNAENKRRIVVGAVLFSVALRLAMIVGWPLVPIGFVVLSWAKVSVGFSVDKSRKAAEADGRGRRARTEPACLDGFIGYTCGKSPALLWSTKEQALMELAGACVYATDVTEDEFSAIDLAFSREPPVITSFVVDGDAMVHADLIQGFKRVAPSPAARVSLLTRTPVTREAIRCAMREAYNTTYDRLKLGSAEDERRSILHEENLLCSLSKPQAVTSVIDGDALVERVPHKTPVYGFSCAVVPFVLRADPFLALMGALEPWYESGDTAETLVARFESAGWASPFPTMVRRYDLTSSSVSDIAPEHTEPAPRGDLLRAAERLVRIERSRTTFRRLYALAIVAEPSTACLLQYSTAESVREYSVQDAFQLLFWDMFLDGMASKQIADAPPGAARCSEFIETRSVLMSSVSISENGASFREEPMKADFVHVEHVLNWGLTRLDLEAEGVAIDWAMKAHMDIFGVADKLTGEDYESYKKEHAARIELATFAFEKRRSAD